MFDQFDGSERRNLSMMKNCAHFSSLMQQRMKLSSTSESLDHIHMNWTIHTSVSGLWFMGLKD